MLLHPMRHEGEDSLTLNIIMQVMTTAAPAFKGCNRASGFRKHLGRHRACQGVIRSMHQKAWRLQQRTTLESPKARIDQVSRQTQ